MYASKCIKIFFSKILISKKKQKNKMTYRVKSKTGEPVEKVYIPASHDNPYIGKRDPWELKREKERYEENRERDSAATEEKGAHFVDSKLGGHRARSILAALDKKDDLTDDEWLFIRELRAIAGNVYEMKQEVRQFQDLKYNLKQEDDRNEKAEIRRDVDLHRRRVEVEKRRIMRRLAEIKGLMDSL